MLKVDAAHPQGRNLVACVAMDRSSDIVDVNGNKTTDHFGDPFTRFLIFGPNGDLLPSVNLDGNGEKFVPGACVACHGGNNYFALANGKFPDGTFSLPAASVPIFGGFPETGEGGPDLHSYFLPYDVGNFLFSSKHPNTLDDLQPPIFELNENAWLVHRDISYINFNRMFPKHFLGRLRRSLRPLVSRYDRVQLKRSPARLLGGFPLRSRHGQILS